MRGIVNANEARNNNIAKQNVHDEIYNIERQIRNFSSSNYRELTVNFTKVTNDNLLSYEPIDSIDLGNDQIIITEHEFTNNDIIEIRSTDTLPEPFVEGAYYGVLVIDENTIQLYDYSDIFQTPIVFATAGNGNISIKKILSSELFYKSWKQFYTFPYAESYINILEIVEEHFRKQGFVINRLENSETQTLFWKIRW